MDLNCNGDFRNASDPAIRLRSSGVRRAGLGNNAALLGAVPLLSEHAAP